MTRNTKILLLIGCLVFLALTLLTINSFSASAENSFRINKSGGLATIDKFAVCRKVTNNDPTKDFFVPVKTEAEWLEFRTNKPVNVVLSECDVCTPACATAGTCQTGGECSAGSCVAVSNVAAGTDLNNQCTASYNSCSGDNRIGPDGNCDGAGACNTSGLSSSCTAGICQTGGGCSAGSCLAVSNVAAGTDPGNECTATYNACSGDNRIGPDGNCNGAGACNTGGLSTACGTAHWEPDTYRCSGEYSQAPWHDIGCSAGSCYDNGTSWANVGPGCDYYDEWTNEYTCSGNQPQRMFHDFYCVWGGCNSNWAYQNYGSACPTAGTCGNGGGCVAGSCNTITFEMEGTDPNNECTDSYTCSGNNLIHNASYCSGGPGCGIISTTACPTAGTCQTGGGCSGGSCTAVTDYSCPETQVWGHCSNYCISDACAYESDFSPACEACGGSASFSQCRPY